MVNESSAFYVLSFKVGFQIYLSYCMLFIPSSRIQTNRRLTLKVLIKEMSLTKPTKVSVMMAISLFMEAIILILSVSIFSRWYELHADTHQLSGYWSGNEWHVDNLMVTFHMNLNNKKQFSKAQNKWIYSFLEFHHSSSNSNILQQNAAFYTAFIYFIMLLAFHLFHH